jgi:flagellum-specific peptidoglycan hydrolase FlgJ
VSDYRLRFLEKALEAARDAQHIFPEYAACEAALESRFGEAQLARLDNNLFGMKQHKHHLYGSHVLPTREYENGEWIIVRQEFIKYPSWHECFQDQMATLLRLAPVMPHYHAALNARDGEAFVREVSKSWSTDPERAKKVLDVYRQRMRLITAAVDT